MDDALVRARPVTFNSPAPVSSDINLLALAAEGDLSEAHQRVSDVLSNDAQTASIPYLELVEAVSAVIIRLALADEAAASMQLLNQYLSIISPLSHAFSLSRPDVTHPPAFPPLTPQTSFVQTHLLPPALARVSHVPSFAVRLALRAAAAADDTAMSIHALSTLTSAGIPIDAAILADLAAVGASVAASRTFAPTADAAATISNEAAPLAVISAAALLAVPAHVDPAPAAIDGMVRALHSAAGGTLPPSVAAAAAAAARAMAFLPGHRDGVAGRARREQPQAGSTHPPRPLAVGALSAVVESRAAPVASMCTASHSLPPVRSMIRALATLVGRPLPPAAAGLLNGPSSARPAVAGMLRSLRVACDFAVWHALDPAIATVDAAALAGVALPPGWWRCLPPDDGALDIVSRACAALGPDGCADALDINVELIGKGCAPTGGALVDPFVSLMAGGETVRAGAYVDALVDVVTAMALDYSREMADADAAGRAPGMSRDYISGTRVAGVDVDCLLSMMLISAAASGADYADCERRLEAAVRAGIPPSCIGAETRFQLAVAACRGLLPDAISAQLDAAMDCRRPLPFIPPSFPPADASVIIGYFTPSHEKAASQRGDTFTLSMWHYAALYAAYCSGGFFRDAAALLNEALASGDPVPDDAARAFIAAAVGRGDVAALLDAHRARTAATGLSRDASAPSAALSIQAHAALGHVPAMLAAVRVALRATAEEGIPLDVGLPLRDACEVMRVLATQRTLDGALADAAAILPEVENGRRVYGLVPTDDDVETPGAYALAWLQWLVDAGYPSAPELVSHGVIAAAIDGRLEALDALLNALHVRGDVRLTCVL